MVIDLICFEEASARELVTALTGRVRHFLHCGTVWVHGPSAPGPDDGGPAAPAVRRLRRQEGGHRGLPAGAGAPGRLPGHDHSSGSHHRSRLGAGESGGQRQPGRVPDPGRRRGAGRCPNLGLETVQHVHADDVARIFMDALASRATAVGESFHSVATTRSDAAGLRRGGGGLVRAGGAAGVPAVGAVADPCRRRTPRSPGITSRTARTAAWTRPSGCWVTGLGTPRWRPSPRRWTG